MLESTSKEHYEKLKRIAKFCTPNLYKKIIESPMTCERCGCIEDFDNVFTFGHLQSLCDDCFCFLNDLDL